MVNMVARELCDGSSVGLHGGGMGLAGRLKPEGGQKCATGGRHADGAWGTPHEGHEGVTDEVGGWVNEQWVNGSW